MARCTGRSVSVSLRKRGQLRRCGRVLLRVETRLTLRPGQPGTRKLVENYGERLLRVRYIYDPDSGWRLKTVELVVEAVPWKQKSRSPRRQDDDVVYVRIAFPEVELRTRARRLGAIWRAPQRLWDITYRDSKRLGIEGRIVGQSEAGAT